MNWKVNLVAVLCLNVAGCASARFPLCPSISEKSYPTPQKSYVNSFILDRAKEKGVRVTELSPFAAELSGGYADIEWFTKNYKFMVCAFAPKQETFDRATYLSCMSHADKWTSIVRSNHPEHLMLEETSYKENCVD